jgi:hypothetical protein
MTISGLKSAIISSLIAVSISASAQENLVGVTALEYALQVVRETSSEEATELLERIQAQNKERRSFVLSELEASLDENDELLALFSEQRELYRDYLNNPPVKDNRWNAILEYNLLIDDSMDLIDLERLRAIRRHALLIGDSTDPVDSESLRAITRHATFFMSRAEYDDVVAVVQDHRRYLMSIMRVQLGSLGEMPTVEIEEALLGITDQNLAFQERLGDVGARFH